MLHKKYTPFIVGDTTDSSIIHKQVGILEKYIHPDYYYYRQIQGYANLALIRFKEPFTCTYCKPIQIATVSPPVKSVVKVLGWGGITNKGAKRVIKILHMLDMTVIETHLCLGSVHAPTYKTNKYNHLTKMQFCLTSEGAKTHIGHGPVARDHGGPVIYENKLVGIMPLIKHFPWRRPLLVADITKYIDWITNTTKLFHLNTP